MPDCPPVWDRDTARKYIARHANHPMTRGWVRFGDLAPADWLLDIGCGTGSSIAAAMPKLEDGRAIGIDPTEEMANTARTAFAEHPRVDIRQAGAEELPLPDKTVTVALANCSASHWSDIRLGLEEVLRVLKPGGKFVCIEEAFSGQINMNDHLPLDQNVLKNPGQIPNLLQRAGFKRIHSRRLHEMGTPFVLITAYKAP